MRFIYRSVLVLCLTLFVLGGCNANQSQERIQKQNLVRLTESHGEAKQNAKKDKKVILVMVDSLESPYIDYGLATNQAPALKFLIDHGGFYKEMVSPFPTMSVVIDSTLLTGTYPDQHHLPGLIWYSAQEKRVINYGTGLQEVMAGGLNQTLEDIFLNLNQKHLNPSLSTLHTDIAKMNKRSGSINGLIFRGNREQLLTIQPWISIPTTLPNEIKIAGPDFFTYGAFANPIKDQVNLPDGPTNYMGFNNLFALKTAEYLIKKNRLPDFLLIYLPDLDQQIHEEGPNQKVIKKVDQDLQKLLNAFGSWEKALQEVNFILMGDSGQTEVFDRKERPLIPLHTLLRDFRLLPIGERASAKDQVALAINERMAFIYSLQKQVSLEQIINKLQSEDRIDHLVWESNGWINVMKPESKKSFKFKSGGSYRDPYGQFWSIDGDEEVLNLNIDQKKKRLTYNDYPDPLRRLEASLHSHQGRFIIANAKTGYTFVGDASPKHIGGGAHGSLHAKDSYVPLIISGTDQRPKNMRIVDLKPFILDLLR